jgi:hypothetical protein
LSAAHGVLGLNRAILAERDGWGAVFKVYLDESGIHAGSPAITVAAYIVHPKNWEAFTRKWKRAIGLIEVYHAVDAANCRGEFRDWTPPLQAADILAYEANKRLRDRNRPNRRALDALVPTRGRHCERSVKRRPAVLDAIESRFQLAFHRQLCT